MIAIWSWLVHRWLDLGSNIQHNPQLYTVSIVLISVVLLIAWYTLPGRDDEDEDEDEASYW